MTITFDSSTNLAGADSGGFDQPSGFLIDQQDVTQIVPLVRADAPEVHHRGNRVYNASWKVSRQHATVAAAEAFILAHAQLFDDVGEVVFTPTSGTALTLTKAIVRCSGAHMGLVTNHSYTVVGVE